jgi:dnd system-associated protein 4
MPDPIPAVDTNSKKNVTIDQLYSKLAQSLVGGDSVFPMYVDLVSFAASLALSRGQFDPVADKATKPVPIPLDYFENHGYGPLIELIGAYHKNDISSLKSSDECTNERLEIFEGFANAGLKVIAEKVNHQPQNIKALELLIREQRPTDRDRNADNDLSDLVEED